MKTVQVVMTCGALLAFLALGAGCSSGDGPKLYTVTGKVTFNGEPVKDGSIKFRVGGPTGHTYAGQITDGSYTVKTEAGPAAVEITASRLIPGKFDKSNGTPEPVGEMYIPKKYNSDTTLKVEIKSESQEMPFDLTK